MFTRPPPCNHKHIGDRHDRYDRNFDRRARRRRSAPATRPSFSPPSPKPGSTRSPSITTVPAIPARSRASRPGTPQRKDSRFPSAVQNSADLGQPGPSPSEQSLEAAVETLAWDYLEIHYGWQKRRRLRHLRFRCRRPYDHARTRRALHRGQHDQPRILRETAMAHPYHHALASVKKWGGEVSDYMPLHAWFDQSKAIAGDFRHRALRHHAEGIFMLVIWTDKPASMSASTEVLVPVVHRRGPAARVARIDAQAERAGGRCLWTHRGRAPGRVPYLLQPRFAYGRHQRPRGE